jgi:hypothetical protein
VLSFVDFIPKMEGITVLSYRVQETLKAKLSMNHGAGLVYTPRHNEEHLY